jgi:tetratricopeptide (TPR) repeat protein
MSGAGRLGDRRRELRKPSLTLAVVAGIIATASCGAPAEPPTPADLLAELERALPSRILEARLSIRQPAEGCTPIPEEYTATCTFPESGSREYLRLAQATNDAQTIGRAGGSAENLRLEGLALLLWSSRQEGTVERAVTRLEAAAELAPRDPDILSDLAAGHLEADRQTERHYHLPRALDAAVRALELAPDHAPALFNSALALERMGLPEEALEGWREYLQQDPVSPWTGEVGQRAGRIEEEIATPRIGADDVVELVIVGDLDGLRRIAQEDPQLARTVAMDRLLPEWGRAYRDGEDSRAGELLESLEVVAGALVDQSVSMPGRSGRLSAPPTTSRPAIWLSASSLLERVAALSYAWTMTRPLNTCRRPWNTWDWPTVAWHHGLQHGWPLPPWLRPTTGWPPPIWSSRREVQPLKPPHSTDFS